MVRVSEDNLVASICRQSYYEFVKEFWGTVEHKVPVWNWHIKYMCDQIQKVCERVFANKHKKYDLIINVSPGTTKSSVGSVFLPPWIWTRMPTAGFIGGSYSAELAMDLSLKSRDVVMSDKYMRIFPKVRIRPDAKAKSQFYNLQRGTRIAVGVGGSIMGKHADIIVIDDPLDPKLAASDVTLKTANEWMGATLSTRKKDKNITPTILIMQRLHQNDCTEHMIEGAKEALRMAKEHGYKNTKLGIRHIRLPAEVTKDIKPKKLRKKYKKGLMDPIRITRKFLLEQQAKGSYHYASQFLQTPVPAGGGMFQTDKITIGVPPLKLKRIVRFWDKAGTQGGRGAFTVGVKIAEDREKRFWVLHVERVRLDSARREKLILRTARMDTTVVGIGVEQEPGSGGKESAENTVRMLAGFRVRIDKPSGSEASKELRADPFSVQVNNGNVSMVEGDWNAAYLEELKFFPNSRYKDQVDGSSGGFNQLTSGNLLLGAVFRR